VAGGQDGSDSVRQLHVDRSRAARLACTIAPCSSCTAAIHGIWRGGGESPHCSRRCSSLGGALCGCGTRRLHERTSAASATRSVRGLFSAGPRREVYAGGQDVSASASQVKLTNENPRNPLRWFARRHTRRRLEQ
jgi:hypothetical protein